LATAVPLSRFTSQIRRGSAFFVRPHYTFMKIKRMFRLQVGMALALLVYLSFAGYLIFKLPSYGLPMRFSNTIAEQQVQTDALPQLQSDFRLAISQIAELQPDKGVLLLVCLGASVAVVVFLGWSIFVVSRIKREVDHVA
jgi:hypothetical protein